MASSPSAKFAKRNCMLGLWRDIWWRIIWERRVRLWWSVLCVGRTLIKRIWISIISKSIKMRLKLGNIIWKRFAKYAIRYWWPPLLKDIMRLSILRKITSTMTSKFLRWPSICQKFQTKNRDIFLKVTVWAAKTPRIKQTVLNFVSSNNLIWID